MAHNQKIADRVNKYLINFPQLNIEKKKMFGGLAFLINGKMCVNVSGDNLMCRFDPKLDKEISNKKGFKPVIMRGKTLNGYCYVGQKGFKSKKDFEYWIDICLDYNSKAKSSKKV